MKKLFFFLFILSPFYLFAQSDESTDFNSENTEVSDSTTIAEENQEVIPDPILEFVIATIKSVNDKWMEVNNISAEGLIKINTRNIQEEADIVVSVKKKDDLYFKIDGPMGIDVGAGHFNREKFTFADYLNDKAYTGTTNALNISSLTKIPVTFDELMNIISGGARIRKYDTDTCWYTEEGEYIVLQFLSAKGTYRKFYVNKAEMYVDRFIHINNKKQITLNVQYSNYVNSGNGIFAKKISVSRPFKGESFIFTYTKFVTGNTFLNFKVDIPSDFHRVKLK